MDEMVNLKLGNNWMDNAVDTTNLIKLIEKCKSVGALGIRTEALDLWKYDTDQEWKNECDKLANELDKNLKLLQEEIARLHLKWQL